MLKGEVLLVSQPLQSESDAHRLTNSNPNRHDLIMLHDELTSTMRMTYFI
ncbi:hypothetical protein KGF92_03800 [Lactiplantibacillus pentosus]|nr:hypothetical protein [Lactiplantibacillus sp. 7.2.4]MBU7479751.1 hypothetical protein [Lactiplantibacillus pentosus]